MKITRVRTLLCTTPQKDIFMKSRERRSAAFIVIETDTELTGLGETYAGYFVPEMVPSIVEFYEPILIGQSPLDVDVGVGGIASCGGIATVSPIPGRLDMAEIGCAQLARAARARRRRGSTAESSPRKVLRCDPRGEAPKAATGGSSRLPSWRVSRSDGDAPPTPA